MHLGKFFKANPNFAILETLTAILKDQVYFENSMGNGLDYVGPPLRFVGDFCVKMLNFAARSF